MIASRTQIILIAGTLFILGVGLTLYKVVALGFPLFPGEYREVWTIESKINFSPSEGPIEVDLTLPENLAG
ncbi:MAG: UUP1 family membrane protein, partial [Pseudomonadota bacterium]